jgi:hypothetical protein
LRCRRPPLAASSPSARPLPNSSAHYARRRSSRWFAKAAGGEHRVLALAELINLVEGGAVIWLLSASRPSLVH